MSRRYTDEQKHLALKVLTENHGDITLTAIQTGIPKRTLQEWKKVRDASRALAAQKNYAPQQQNAATNPPQLAPLHRTFPS